MHKEKMAKKTISKMKIILFNMVVTLLITLLIKRLIDLLYLQSNLP